jgi:hypothetical protein
METGIPRAFSYEMKFVLAAVPGDTASHLVGFGLLLEARRAS